ncbi:MAG: hypothetical protein D6766_08645 [Verrucomicrobia bacterium]|nr:MAG: hypothetical protein D6766_08645 [Verrucomicrobiota bacterium]
MAAAVQEALVEFDFTDPAIVRQWRPLHDVGPLAGDAEGLRIEIRGPDPYIGGPPRDYPPDQPLWLTITLWSEQGGGGQIFYHRGAPNERDSVRFGVKAGEWQTVRLQLPPLGPRYRLRFDPPGQGGLCRVRSIRIEPRRLYTAPEWPPVEAPRLGADALELRAGSLRLRHAPNRFNAFVLEADGRVMATGNPRPLLGYEHDGRVRWIPFGWGDGARVTTAALPALRLGDRELGGGLLSRAVFNDPDGGLWEVEQRFQAEGDGLLRVKVSVRPDPPRQVLYLPVFMLHPGLGEGGFGTNKTQALLAGIEYLANEPSSSTADLNEPASWRQVPDMLKLTAPLMAVAAGERWLAVSWAAGPDPAVGVVFDSPDRLFHSGGSVMGLLFPGSDGANREQRSLLPYGPTRLRGRLEWEGLILAGRGRTVVPAVVRHVELNPLPPLPDPGMTPRDYFRLAARGWLDSACRVGDRFRHAVWGNNFPPQPAADAALWMEWLADRVGDASLAARLREQARRAIERVPRDQRLRAQIGHVRTPLPPLVFGGVIESAERARRQAEDLLRRFEPDGTVLYRQTPGRPDYGRTHWSRTANGLTAQVVNQLLEAASFAGDERLLREALAKLEGLKPFRDTVPRGAQTWEIPLHTPDILASAHLVAAWVRGYELTGNPEHLEQARYWAWTGVPFVYLRRPVDGRVGPYSTIAVLGATSWVAPVWIGLPVQWCGLVYADALQRLARHDSEGPWKQLADGIVRAGIQHTWPADDPERRGLLPDSFDLRAQTRNGPAINPATLLAPAIDALGGPPAWDFQVVRSRGWRMYAPGRIEWLSQDEKAVRFRVHAWPRGAWRLFVNGVHGRPEVEVDGRPWPESRTRYHGDRGWLALELEGQPTVTLRPAGRNR